MDQLTDDLLSPGYTAHDEARYLAEPAKRSGRTAFARDRARILHSAGLRRLAAKTQVLVAGADDFQRTRLTHTLEVAQVGRELGASLGCDPDLVEVACLAHDLGHPPFGHNGEDALNDVSQTIGGFEGNAQSFRVLTRLEAKTLDAESGRSIGLNLTRAALDAASKYPWPKRDGSRKFGVYDDDLEIFEWVRECSPGRDTCMEAQVMDWADDVAYSVHDVEDAVHLAHLDLRELGSASELAQVVALAQKYYAKGVDAAVLEEALVRLMALPMWPSSFDGSMESLVQLKSLTSVLIGRFCLAAQRATRAEFGNAPLGRYDARLVVPDDARHEVAVMKAIAARYSLRREGYEEINARQRELLKDLVAVMLLDGGKHLEPWLWPTYLAAESDDDRLRVVVDQVASLTDVSAAQWHERLCR